MSWLPDWLTGHDAEKARQAAEADAELQRINQERAAELGDAWLDQVNENWQTQEVFGEAAQRDAIDAAFVEGLQEGRANITGTIKGAFNFVGKTLASVLLGIPVWVWLLAGVGLWIYLGAPGLRQLKGKFA